MTKKMKESRDSNKVCAAVLTNLSKAFDCLLHDLLIAALHVFGFDLKSLKVTRRTLGRVRKLTKNHIFDMKDFWILFWPLLLSDLI